MKVKASSIKNTISKIADNTSNIVSGNNLITVNLSELIDHDKNKEYFRELDSDEFNELKKSIEEIGLLEPLVVRKLDNGYQILSGHQRAKALKALGKDSVAVSVVGLDDTDAELALLHANIKQRKMNDIEIAKAIQAEINILKMKKEQGTLKGQIIDVVSDTFGISKDKAKRLNRLNRLIKPFQDLVEKGSLTTGKAQEIGLLDLETQELLYKSLKENAEQLSLEEIKNIKKQNEDERDHLKRTLEEIQEKNRKMESDLHQAEEKNQSLERQLEEQQTILSSQKNIQDPDKKMKEEIQILKDQLQKEKQKNESLREKNRISSLNYFIENINDNPSENERKLFNLIDNFDNELIENMINILTKIKTN